MIVRPESAKDYDAVRNVLLAAFADHPYSHQTEHLIVEELRAADAMTVGLVAELDGEVVGHIAFSPVTIGGKDCGWLGLGPIGVWPERQRQGIGKRMMEEGLSAIRALGARGCVLVGDPAYYERFGFRSNPALTMEGVPAENLMCLPMAEPMPEGEVVHHRAFHAGE